MKKVYRYSLPVIAVLFLAYHSVYFRKLSEVRAEEEPQLDFAAMADSLYQGILRMEEVMPLGELMSRIQAQPDSAFAAYGNRLGIGASAYFFVRAGGTVSGITNGQIGLQTNSPARVDVDAKYIFGNALRDASGLVRLTDFKTTAEFNQLSEALNALVREQVLPPVVGQLAVGDSITVTGAVRFSRKELRPSQITVIPAQISRH